MPELASSLSTVGGDLARFGIALAERAGTGGTGSCVSESVSDDLSVCFGRGVSGCAGLGACVEGPVAGEVASADSTEDTGGEVPKSDSDWLGARWAAKSKRAVDPRLHRIKDFKKQGGRGERKEGEGKGIMSGTVARRRGKREDEQNVERIQL